MEFKQIIESFVVQSFRSRHGVVSRSCFSEKSKTRDSNGGGFYVAETRLPIVRDAADAIRGRTHVIACPSALATV